VSGTTTTQNYALVRAGERRPPQEVPATGYTYQPMAVGWPGQRMDAFVLTFPVKNRADVLTAHEGEEMSFVLQGEILFQLGDEKIPLKTGDCLYFNAEIPTWARTSGAWTPRCSWWRRRPRPGREYGWWKAPAPRRGPGPADAAPRGQGETPRHGTEDLHLVHARLPGRLRDHRPREGRARREARGPSGSRVHQGYLCGKTYRFPERVYSPERQLHPLKRSNGRTDGGWDRIGWDEALDLVPRRSAATWPTRARCPSCTTSAPAPGAPPSS